MQIIDRIMVLITALGFKNQTDFLRDMNISHTVMAKWKKGNPIDSIVLSLIESKYNISREWLRDGKGNMYSNPNNLPSFIGEVKSTIIRLVVSPKLNESDAADVLKYVKERLKLAEMRESDEKKENA